jgi:uncharacterized protein (UPF0276 family)
MILTTNISPALIELLQDDKEIIDGLEVGPWFTISQIVTYKAQYSRYPFYFHGVNLANKSRMCPLSDRDIENYLFVTGSPLISIHLSFLKPIERAINLVIKRRFPKINPIKSKAYFISRIKKIISRINIPVLLENLDPIPGYDNYEIQPINICFVLQETGCNLLLDIGHARLSAEYLGIPPKEYISLLPLTKIKQIHVSGPRIRNGQLFDAHDTMQNIDYELLEHVLAKTNPNIITLEYIKEKEFLRDQLKRLRTIIN